MGEKIVIDFRLIEVSIGLSTLEVHLKRIEEQIEQRKKEIELELEKAAQRLRDDYAEWDIIRQELEIETEFSLPHILRGPFLVTLFSVYESAVKEIAGLIQKKQGQQIGIDDLKGDLLKRAKRYYKHILGFELSLNNERWKRVVVLSDLRNAIAHTNGRLDMISSTTRRKILRLEGVSDEIGFVILSGDFLRETFAIAKDELEDLIARYKEWDTANRKPS